MPRWLARLSDSRYTSILASVVLLSWLFCGIHILVWSSMDKSIALCYLRRLHTRVLYSKSRRVTAR